MVSSGSGQRAQARPELRTAASEPKERAAYGAVKARKAARASLGLPKRPLCAYFYFLRQSRPAIQRQAEPDADGAPRTALTTGQVTKEAARRWKALPSAERRPFEDLARLDRLRYRRQLAEAKAAARANVKAQRLARHDTADDGQDTDPDSPSSD